jgi:uncharacterized damage-inducible protein DinB
MISLEVALKQMAWADEKLFAFLLTQPDEVWRAKFADDEWPVYSYVFHLVASADWYAFELGRKLTFSKEPESIAEVRGLGNIWKETNAYLVEQASLNDEMVKFEENGQEHEVLRSTVLSQAVIHAVEHRIHIATALKISGFVFPELEDFSVWGYINSLK